MKKLTSILALLLCLVMLFTSCLGNDTGDDPAVTTEDPAVTTGDPGSSKEPNSDIDAIVKAWNDAVNVEVSEIDVTEIKNIALDLLEKYQLSVTDLKLNGENIDGTVLVNTEEIYIGITDEDMYVKFEVDGNKIDILSIGSYLGDIEEVSFNRIDLEDVLAKLGEMATDSKIQIPELKAEDIKDEGDRTYTISRDVIDDIIDSYIDLVLEVFVVSDSEMRETKALIKGYLEDITIDVKYKFDGDDMSTIFTVDVPEEIYFDFIDSSYDADVINAMKSVEHDYSFKFSMEESKTSVNVDFDINIPMILDYEDNGTIYVQHIEFLGDLKIDIAELLSKNAEKIKIGLEVVTEYAAYAKKGSAYVDDKSLLPEGLFIESAVAVEVSFVGEEFKAVLSAENDGQVDSYEISGKVKIGNVGAFGLTPEMEGYISKFEAMRPKYDSALARAEGRFVQALSRLDLRNQEDTHESITYYDAELGAYFVFDVSCEGGYMSYSFTSVSLTDPMNFFFVKDDGAGSTPAVYSYFSPNVPVNNLNMLYGV